MPDGQILPGSPPDPVADSSQVPAPSLARKRISTVVLVVLGSFLILAGGISSSIFLPRIIRGPAPQSSQTQIPASSQKDNETESIDISKISYNRVWKSHTIFDRFGINLPSGWYEKQANDNSLTFGAGIKSYITIRIGSADFENEKLAAYQKDGRRIEFRRNYLVGGKSFKVYHLSAKCVADDVCDSGFNDWYLSQGENIFTISELGDQETRNLVIISILYSIAPLDSFTPVMPYQGLPATSSPGNYVNPLYGFGFRYPLHIDFQGDISTSAYPPFPKGSSNPQGDLVFNNVQNGYYKVFDNFDMLSPADWLAQNQDVIDNNPYSQKLINGLEAYEFYNFETKDEWGKAATAKKIVMFFANEYVVFLVNQQMNNADFDGIVNTFVVYD